MKDRPSVVFIGLAITSAWGNGHATTYRALLKALYGLGYDVIFLERDVPWYAAHRDRFEHEYSVELYDSLTDLISRFAGVVSEAEAVIVGSYVPEGAEVVRWTLATARGLRLFYDIDTPVTLARLASGEPTYIDRESVGALDAYLSFSGGPVLGRIERDFGARHALPLYCSVDPDLYAPGDHEVRHDLGYLGTYSQDRQAKVDRLFLEAARAWPQGSFVLAGPCYPEQSWPPNVTLRHHVGPDEHAKFYGSLRFALNLTRGDMVQMGHSPSVRLFEAAACGVPIITDSWKGMAEVFTPGEEILVVEETEAVLECLCGMTDSQRRALGERARARVLREHTCVHRARQLAGYLEQLFAAHPSRRPWRSANGGLLCSAEGPAP